MAEAFVPWLPTQPYNIVPRMHPGEQLLMRVIGGGRDLHPYHHHGNHARSSPGTADLLASPGSTDPDLAQAVFTIQSVPGQTVDAIFEWTGKGWAGTSTARLPMTDLPTTASMGTVTGSTDPGNPDNAIPIRILCRPRQALSPVLPEKQDLAFGGWYGGSPFLGTTGALPPGEGGLNPNGGFSYMWHSHTEKELTNFDIFPGGMLTMLIIESWNVDIP